MSPTAVGPTMQGRSGAASSSLDRRRRAVDAMGLGPLWLLKSPTLPADGPGHGQGRAAAIASMDLAALAEAVSTCTDCRLCESRTHAVVGEGSDQPDWLVVGAAPSAEDDLAGTPLTGQPGRLLDAMLASIALVRRRDVFVTTAVKCRPPGDRAPTAAELAACRPYLDRQVALLKPRRLLALGKALADPLGIPRGELQLVIIGEHGMPAITTHHPSQLLSEPLLKAEAWADLCMARSA